MSVYSVDNDLAFLIFAGNVNADLDMRAFDLMIESLADIVKKTGSARHSRLETKLRSHDAAKISHLKRMIQNILTIACTEM